MTQYVQSKWSTDAPIHELVCWQPEEAIKWVANDGQGGNLYLPKSEYIEVPAPATWEEVLSFVFHNCEPIPFMDGTMRVRYGKDSGMWIIERKVQP